MDAPDGINWEEQVRNGGGFFTVGEMEDDPMMGFHIDLDDEIYGADHNRQQFFGDGRNSLVFNTPLIDEIRTSPSFARFFSGAVPITPDGGIQKSILRCGNGISPLDGSQVWVHYIGFAEGFPEPFDSTRKRKCLNSFILNGETLPCLDLSVRSMAFNEVSLFIADPDYAYGRCGCPPRIPPDSRVLFIIELITMEASFQQPIFLRDQPERQGLPFKNVFDEVDRLKNVGNNKFQESDYEGALRCYKIGAGILQEYHTLDPNHQSLKQNQLYKLLSNMAECFLRQEEPSQVIELFEEVKRRKIPFPDGKLLVRYAKALVAEEKHKQALEAIHEALEVEPGHPKILNLLQDIERRIQESERETDKFCNRLFRLYLNDLTETKTGDLKEKPSTKMQGSNPVSILLGGFFIATSLARPQEEKVYPARLQPELDSINVDHYLKNERLMNLQIKCVLYNGPCDVVGRWVKPRVAASFYGQCPLCTPKQELDVQKIIAYMQEKRPEEYKLAVSKFLRSSGIQVPSSTVATFSTTNTRSEESSEEAISTVPPTAQIIEVNNDESSFQ
ncbi:unnamed protein product [Allacma fusca]|uniref:peptidylprolyl isomerase n=1 Tax=Allacma fusca TaxID=39272 RepID=A0A8J2NXM0_9HEXA|nr:unnamed protein product [Allacma fusca]